MGQHTIRFGGRQVQVTASKDTASDLSLALHKLEDISNHCVKMRDGKKYAETWAMYGKGETPPREPEEFERKRTALFNMIPPMMNKAQTLAMLQRAQELFDAHVHITAE